jgi:hypothetical protein
MCVLVHLLVPDGPLHRQPGKQICRLSFEGAVQSPPLAARS